MKFKPEVRTGILTAIKIGVSHERAALSERVSRRQLYRWLARGREDAATGRRTAYSRFAEQFRQAEAEALANLEATVYAASQSDWRAGAWLLARKRPGEYGSVDERERLDKRAMAAELIGFLERHISPLAFDEVCQTLASRGDAELDARLLPVPA